jgi:hypothetical protein
MTRRLLALAAAVALCAPAVTSARPSGSSPAAERVAKRHVERRYEVHITETFSIQSRRDRRWALVTMFTRRGTPIAAWLRGTGGRWRVKHTEKAHDETRPPKSLRVPCDVQPAFSEPDC